MTTPTRAREYGLCMHGMIFTRCETFEEWFDPDGGVPHFQCLKGHHPRFYLRFTVDGTPDGYRRRCEDFEERGKE